MRPQTVLVVDEHPIIREYAGVVLSENIGLHVVEAADLEDAVNVLQTSPDIQLALIGVPTPRSEDPFAGVRLLASRWPHLSIIVATGGPLPRAETLPPRARVLLKPYPPTALVAATREALSGLWQPIILKRPVSAAPGLGPCRG
ncbi:response regulator transcription factor [Salinarimonas soli]|uniref:Response regulator transcription factor n=1 Tax=Salinarimonas soli TaxID=1638099 RepID=A0A5B2VCK5_9HYPH|nr:response regulator transcription factor [Salinarimonas soli]KAA2236475.1 response regulator transcription factor [Salinarimonas soli]